MRDITQEKTAQIADAAKNLAGMAWNKFKDFIPSAPVATTTPGETTPDPVPAPPVPVPKPVTPGVSEAPRPAVSRSADWANTLSTQTAEPTAADQHAMRMREAIRTGDVSAAEQTDAGQYYQRHYTAAAGAGAPPRSPVAHYLQQQADYAIANQDVNQVADVVADTLSLAQKNFDPKTVQSTLAGIAKRIDTSKWGPEQWKSWNDRIAGQLADPTAQKLLGGIAALTGAKVSPVDLLHESVAGAATGAVRDMEMAANKYIESNPKGTGFTDWMTSNWQNFLVPAGALMMMFGGKTSKIVGLLAMAGGATNLYKRYNNLVKNEDIQGVVRDSMAYKNPQGELVPFGNLDQIQNPEAKQAAQDMAFLLRSGFKDVIMRKTSEKAQKFTESLFGPGAGKDVFERQRSALKQPSDVYKDVAQNIWGSARDTATNLFDQAREGLKSWTAQ